jgi:peptide/nickel transport system substrate-binding protein
MNNARGVLRDKRVRQAISQAINRQEMIDAFFQGKGRLISGPFPPSSWAYNLDVKPLSYDPERAKSLLAAAGLRYKDGRLVSPTGQPVTLSFAVPLAGESEMIKRVVLAFQGYLEAVGIKVELQFMDWLVWKKKVLAEHDYDVTIAAWSFDDASNITSLFHSSSSKPWGNNFVQYKNTEVDSLLTEADVTNDFDMKRAIYHKIHAVLAEDAPYTYLWTLQHHAAHNQRLSGVRVEPFAFFKYILGWRMENNHDSN